MKIHNARIGHMDSSRIATIKKIAKFLVDQAGVEREFNQVRIAPRLGLNRNTRMKTPVSTKTIAGPEGKFI